MAVAVGRIGVAIRRRCGDFTLWALGRLVYPDSSDAPRPNPDLPGDIQRDYLEAASILSRSPRGAAALLRLCIQNLCRALGKKGRNVDDDIASMVKDGLPLMVKQALDIIRVTGNEAVHPGELVLRDDPQTALQLFGLVNFIADNRISEPRRIQKIYGALPESKRLAIDARDQRALEPPTESS
jgi:hypothetical protein